AAGAVAFAARWQSWTQPSSSLTVDWASGPRPSAGPAAVADASPSAGASPTFEGRTADVDACATH
ncbi:hypothetical protein ABZW03_28230, partial [Kitasatospora sp. NPDC004799]|uniref:hypothetical protein n=1 Tax=Kitasatospora sp. NPDC004799 TaxID=3154460 RepID=UPI0033B60524